MRSGIYVESSIATRAAINSFMSASIQSLRYKCTITVILVGADTVGTGLAREKYARHENSDILPFHLTMHARQIPLASATLIIEIVPMIIYKTSEIAGEFWVAKLLLNLMPQEKIPYRLG